MRWYEEPVHPALCAPAAKRDKAGKEGQAEKERRRESAVCFRECAVTQPHRMSTRQRWRRCLQFSLSLSLCGRAKSGRAHVRASARGGSTSGGGNSNSSSSWVERSRKSSALGFSAAFSRHRISRPLALAHTRYTHTVHTYPPAQSMPHDLTQPSVRTLIVSTETESPPAFITPMPPPAGQPSRSSPSPLSLHPHTTHDLILTPPTPLPFSAGGDDAADAHQRVHGTHGRAPVPQQPAAARHAKGRKDARRGPVAVAGAARRVHGAARH